jgi:hypothetical protein
MIEAMVTGEAEVQEHLQNAPHLTAQEVITEAGEIAAEAVTAHESAKPHLTESQVDGRIDEKIASIPDPVPTLVFWEVVEGFAGLPDGTPVKVKNGEIVTYHILGLGDTPIGEICWKGDVTRVVKIDVNIPGQFADTANTAAIVEKTGDPLRWDGGPGKLCAIRHDMRTPDSAATDGQPAINVSLGGVNALFVDSETSTVRKTETCNADVVCGDDVEIKIVQATGGTPGHDAESLSVSLLFALL